MRIKMEKRSLNKNIDLLLRGFTELKDNGRFNEPNLDGSAGDYISFSSWEWPYAGRAIWSGTFMENTKSDELYQIIDQWFRNIEKGLPCLNVNTTALMLPLSLFWSHNRQPHYQQVLDRWANRVMTELPRTPEQTFSMWFPTVFNVTWRSGTIRCLW